MITEKKPLKYNPFTSGVSRAIELGCDIVIASHSGKSVYTLLDAIEGTDFHNKIIVVRSVSKAGKNPMAPEVRQDLEARGVIIVTAAHVLSGAERGLSTRFQGAYPVEIMAHTLRTLGQGTKVCFECAVMALDADAIPYGRPVVTLAGKAPGIDTAIVITPSYAASILDTKIHEIICKPDLY